MTSKDLDPYYNRKPVPAAFTQDVGITGLSPSEEHNNREKKYSATGDDVRKLSTKVYAPKTDPFYSRKPVSKAEIAGVGETGLTPQQEYENRERKYSVNGGDVRRFSTKVLEPANDPYYNRQPVAAPQTAGVGELEITPAEAYQQRERKQSLFQLSEDPFDQLGGNRHRASVSDVGGAAAVAASRRRSSAVAPDQQRAMHSATASHGHFSGYGNGDKLAPIESRPELPPMSTLSETSGSGTTAAESNGSAGGHAMFYDQATGRDDDIGPLDMRPSTTTATAVA